MDVSGRQNVGNEIIRQGVGIVGRTEKNRGKLVEMVQSCTTNAGWWPNRMFGWKHEKNRKVSMSQKKCEWYMTAAAVISHVFV